MSSTVPDAKARHTLDVCSWFRDKGWSVTVYTRDARAVDRFFAARGISLRPLGMSGLSDLHSLRSLTHDLRKEEQGAIIHAHRVKDAILAISARIFARREDIRVVLTVHNSRWQNPPAILRGIFSRLDEVIFGTSCVAETYSRVFPIKEGRGRIMHHTFPDREGLPLQEPVSGPMSAIWHGRIVPGKGLEYLIDSLPLIKGSRIRIRIVGSGNPDYVDSLRRRAMGLGVNQMIDWIKGSDDIFREIAGCHFGVSPATEDEAFGYPNLEYMAAGRPQIATAGIVQREYLADGRDSIIVPKADKEALAEAIIQLASDGELRKNLGMAARRRFLADLSWLRFAADLEQIYRGESVGN